jgi:hypothetical protein
MSDKSSIVVLDEQDLRIIEGAAEPGDFPITKGDFPITK